MTVQPTTDARQQLDLDRIPLPPGAMCEDGWLQNLAGQPPYRIIRGPEYRLVPGVDPKAEVFVEAAATQLSDGTIMERNLPCESGPTVSVNCHWENYLRADEARELAVHILKSAELIEDWVPADDQHVCEFNWCHSRWKDDSHWGVVYYPATLKHSDPYHLTEGRTPLRIGVGVDYEPDRPAAIIVHLDGGSHDADEDAFMTVNEAIALRDALSEAIVNGKAALQHMVESMIGGAE